MNQSSEQPQPQQTSKRPRGAVLWVSIIAVVIAIIAILVAGFAYEQLETANKNNAAQALSSNSQQQAVQGSLQQLQTNLSATQQNVSQLMRRFGSSQQQTTLSQVAYLINLANLQLSVSHNAQASLHMLSLAQQKVQNLNDPRLFALNKVLLKDIAELKAVPKFNMTQVISEIDALNDAIAAANVVPNQKDLNRAEKKSAKAVAQTDTNNKDKWYDRAWHHLSGIKDLIIIRKTDPDVRPLLDSEQQVLIKSTMQSKLLLAEYAAIQHHNKLFQQHLTTVKKWIKKYFFDSVNREQLLAQLETIQNTNVSPKIPDIGDTITVLNQTLSAVADSQPTLTRTPDSTPKSTPKKPLKLPHKKTIKPHQDTQMPSTRNPGVAI